MQAVQRGKDLGGVPMTAHYAGPSGLTAARRLSPQTSRETNKELVLCLELQGPGWPDIQWTFHLYQVLWPLVPHMLRSPPAPSADPDTPPPHCLKLCSSP